MSSLKLKGGKKLSGELKIQGNKNAALPMIAASLLTDKEVVLKNVPDILDVRIMLEALNFLGVDFSFTENTLKIKAEKINCTSLSRNLCSKIRTSILFAAPLLSRCGKVSFWPPGGDIIGRRRLDGHFYGLKTLGAEFDKNQWAPFQIKCSSGFYGKELFLDESSVTATEQIMLAAAVSEGKTIIRNAACEPHVQDLALLLNKMGGDISGAGTNTIHISGSDKLNGTEHNVIEDHIETGSFLTLGAVCGGELTIHGIKPSNYWMLRRVFEKFNIHFEFSDEKSIHLPANQNLKINKDFGNAIPQISDGPWPQLPSDIMSSAIVLATQSEGTVLFFEKMFESRIYFVDRLISMGANAIVCDPHRVVISGPSKLRGLELSSPDIRAGMAMIIAALCAEEESIIHNAEVISRGYENVCSKIQSLNGDITKTK